MQPTLTTIPRSRALCLALCLVPAACNGGGPLLASAEDDPGGEGDGGGDVQGEYAVEGFGYEDPLPDAFHPLGASVFTALRRDEVAVVVGSNAGGVASGMAWERDDAGAGFAEAALPSSLWPESPYDTVTAQLDDDPWSEVATIARVSKSVWRVRVFGVDEGGAWAQEGTFDVWQSGANYKAIRLEAGDVDGDERDELVLAASQDPLTSWVRVYEDPAESDWGSILWEFKTSGADNDARGVTAQLDDDAPREVVTFQGHGNHVRIRAFDDATTGFAQLSAQIYDSFPSDTVHLLAGNFDDDPRDEVVAFADGVPFVLGLVRLGVTVIDDALTGFQELEAQELPLQQGEWDDHSAMLRRRIALADTDLDGRDEVCWLQLQSGVGGFPPVWWDVKLHRWWPDHFKSVTLHSQFMFTGGPWEGLALEAGDRDADGREELVAVVTVREPSKSRVLTYDVDYNPKGQPLVKKSTKKLSVPSGHTMLPVLAAGDFDRDGTRLRWTGTKELCLPDPMPLCLLAAPPVQLGIDQNLGASGVSYGLETTTTESFSVTTGTSLSTWSGFEWESLFGAVGGSATTTITSEMEQTLGQSTSLSKSKSFQGGWDQDSVVFQGTLFQCYRYEVLSGPDPTAVGTQVSINVPVDAKTFKWSLDFYNQTFADVAPIQPSVLGHTIGDVASYPSRAELLSLLGSYTGWEGETQTVGQGSASVGLGLALEEVTTQGESVTYSVESAAEFTVGGAVFGASYGLSTSNLYEVSLSHTTSYDATIGDIPDPQDWNAWAYDVGIVAYTRDEAGELPFQVVRFWTAPFGTGY